MGLRYPKKTCLSWHLSTVCSTKGIWRPDVGLFRRGRFNSGFTWAKPHEYPPVATMTAQSWCLRKHWLPLAPFPRLRCKPRPSFYSFAERWEFTSQYTNLYSLGLSELVGNRSNTFMPIAVTLACAFVWDQVYDVFMSARVCLCVYLSVSCCVCDSALHFLFTLPSSIICTYNTHLSTCPDMSPHRGEAPHCRSLFYVFFCFIVIIFKTMRQREFEREKINLYRTV